MINSSKRYSKYCVKLAKEIKNTSKRNKEFKSKPEDNKEIEK